MNVYEFHLQNLNQQKSFIKTDNFIAYPCFNFDAGVS